MRTHLRDVYRSVLWLGLVGLMALPIIIITQPASFRDGLLLSGVLVSCFFVLLASVAAAGVWVRQRHELSRGEGFVYATALRQGALVGGLFVTLLTLQLMRVVTIVDAALFVGLAVMIELYLGSRAEAR